jgi:hypothetical protein
VLTDQLESDPCILQAIPYYAGAKFGGVWR